MVGCVSRRAHGEDSLAHFMRRMKSCLSSVDVCPSECVLGLCVGGVSAEVDGNWGGDCWGWGSLNI